MNNLRKNKKNDKGLAIDYELIYIPFLTIVFLSLGFFLFPEKSRNFVEFLRFIFVEKLGFLYMVFGLVVFLLSIGLGLSKYGTIVLGKENKPVYKTLSWGAMIFTSTMAADIVYWSLIEWAYYFNESPLGLNISSLAQKQDLASSYPLFHWGPIAWSFYLLPAAAYAYMFYVKGRKRQRVSEACRPVLKDRTEGPLGRTIDLLAITGLLAGSATTFSLATPLLSLLLSKVFGIEDSKGLTIGILITIALVYTLALAFKMEGVSKLANLCVVFFMVLAGIFLFLGPTSYIIESGVTGIGRVLNDFFSMATWMDPLRSTANGGSGFPQKWTIFYWAYWISWFVATPFFIARISEGRTIRQLIFGGYGAGILGTYTSFIVFGNYGLFQQVTGKVDGAGMLARGISPAQVILDIIETLPIPKIAMLVFVVSMIAFYSSTFDANTLVVSEYCMKNKGKDQEPPNWLKIYWSIIFIVFPIVLIFNDSTLEILQTLSIVTAFPLAMIMGLIIYSFFKELRGHDL